MKQIFTKISCFKYLVAFLVLLIFAKQASAIPYTWVGASGGSWNTATNWSPNGTPGVNDDVTISSSSAMSIALGNTVVVNSLSVSGGNTISLTGAFSITINNAFTFSGGTKFSHVNTIILGFNTSTSDFTLTGNDASNYFTGSGASPALTLTPRSSQTINLWVDPSFTWTNFSVTKGTIILKSNCTTNRLGLSSLNNQILRLDNNVTFTLNGTGSSSLGLNSASAAGYVDASATGTKFTFMGNGNAGASVFAGNNRIFANGATVNNLEINSSSIVLFPNTPLKVNTLTLTAGNINNIANNITILDGGTIIRSNQNALLSAPPIFGLTSTDKVNIQYTANCTTGNELFGTTGSIGTVTVNNAVTATLSNSSVTAISLSNISGATFNSPTITIAAPTGSNGIQATATCIVTGSGSAKTLLSVLITNPGYGYTSAPTITFSDPSGTGTATFTPSVNSQTGTTTIDVLSIGGGTSGVVTYPNTSAKVMTLNVKDLTVNTGATFTCGTQTNNVTHLLNVGGSITNNGTFTAITTAGTKVVDVTMNGSVAQSINSAITFNGLTISNTAAPVSMGAALNTTSLTINNSAILNMQTNALSSVTNISGTGKLQTQATASAVPASKTWTFNVEYNNATGGQAVIGGTYTGGLTNSNTSGVNTISTAVTIGNVLTLNASSNLLLSTGITITAGTAFTGSTGSGTLQINDNNSSAYRIPRDLSWGGTVQFNFAGNSRIVPGTYNNLQVDDGTARTVNWGLANEAGTYTISGSLITSSTSYVINLATVAFSGTNQAIPAISVYNLSLTGTGTTFPSGTINVANTFNPGSITTANQGTISFNGSGAQTIPVFNYSRLLTSTGGTKTAAGNIDIATSLQINSGTILDMATYNLTNTAGSLSNSGLGTLITSSTSSTPLPTGRSWGNYTVEYASLSGGQSVVAGTYDKLLFDNTSGTNSAVGNVTVSSTLTTTSGGTFAVGANTLTLNSAAISGTGTISTTSSSSLSFGGTGAGPFSIPSNITALNNLTLNNTNATPATLTAGASISLAGNLALTSGTFNDGGNTITVAGSISGTGTHTGTGKITMTGSSRTISGATFQNLTLSSAGTLTLSGSPTIIGTLTVTSGTLATSTNTLTLDATTGTGVFGPSSRLSIAASGTVNFNSRPVTLQSSSAGTASIATISGTLSGASNVTVERYIPSNTRRSYVLVGSPASGASIYNAWQEGGASNAGYGTLITGGAAGGTLGFDLPTTSGKSIFTYNDNNASGSKWVGLANTNATNLSAGAGYLLFVRGDRTLNLATTPTASGNTTLRATGTIGQGSISPTLLSGANKYTLIANPYPCAIDWNSGSITKTNLTGNFTVYDANNNVFVSSNGTVKTPNVGNQQAGYIQSGQAFFVQNDGTGNGAITFTEGAKTTSATTSSSTTVFGEAANNAQLNINVYHTADNSFVDGAVALFGSKYKAAVDANEDIYKFTNLNETFGLRRNNVVLGLEARPAVSSKDSLYFSLSNFAKKAYSLVIDGSNLTSTTVKLEDKYTSTTTEIDVTGTTTYNFTVTDDVASYSNDRFVITFGSTAASSAVIDGTAASSLYVKMSPNPVSNQLQVSFKTATVEATSINVVNSLGQVVKTVNAGNVANGNVSVPVSELANGVYSVQLLSGNKVIHTQRVVKTAN